MSAWGPHALGFRGWAVIGGLFVAWIVAVASRLHLSGDVYGLNYRLFQPDGVCYAAFAFDFAGSGIEGRAEVARAYAEQGTSIGPLGPDLSDPSQCNTGLRARILYPILSVPFISLFGYMGLLVVPALSWLAAVLIPAWLMIRRGFFLAPALAGLLVLASTSVARWSVANVVDPLIMGLVALSLLTLPIFNRKRHWALVAPFGVIVILGSLTRQSFPIWIALVLIPWLVFALLKKGTPIRKRLFAGNPWLPFALTGTVTAIVACRVVQATLGAQNSAYVISLVTESLTVANEPSGVTQTISRLEHPTQLAVNVLITEFGQLAVLDKSLLIALGLAFFGVWKHRRWAASYAFLGVLVTVLGIGAVNSTLGINFRFQLAVVPLIVLLASSWSTPSRGEVVGRAGLSSSNEQAHP